MICVISHIMGAADALVMGIIAIVTGIKKATSVFFMALMFVSIISGVLLIIKRLKRKAIKTRPVLDCFYLLIYQKKYFIGL